MNFATPLRKLWVLGLILGISASSAVAGGMPVRDVLKIQKGCYPVTYDSSTDKIGIICRGQNNWVPEGVQFFNSFTSNHHYRTKVGTDSTLDQDISDGIGPGPWFAYYFGKMDSANIPRPK